MGRWARCIKMILGDDYEVVRSEFFVGAPRPAGKFATIKLISGPSDYTIDENLVFKTDGFCLQSAKWFSLSLQTFREGAADAINLVRLKLYDPDIVDFLYRGHISVTTRGGVTDLSEELEVGWIDRFQCDIDFAMGIEVKTNVGIIENANIESSL